MWVFTLHKIFIMNTLTSLLIAIAAVSFSHHRNSEAQAFSHREVINNAIHGEVILCSGEVIELGKCLGKANCTACTTCEYCKHCNNGGSCGVCAPGNRYEPEPPKYRSSPKPAPQPKTTYPKSESKIYIFEETDKDEKFTPESTLEVEEDIFIVSAATSLRKLPNSESQVLKRLAAGDEVSVIDCSNKYWCKVIYDDKVGWVKKHLLQEK